MSRFIDATMRIKKRYLFGGVFGALFLFGCFDSFTSAPVSIVSDGKHSVELLPSTFLLFNESREELRDVHAFCIVERVDGSKETSQYKHTEAAAKTIPFLDQYDRVEFSCEPTPTPWPPAEPVPNVSVVVGLHYRSLVLPMWHKTKSAHFSAKVDQDGRFYWKEDHTWLNKAPYVYKLRPCRPSISLAPIVTGLFSSWLILSIAGYGRHRCDNAGSSGP